MMILQMFLNTGRSWDKTWANVLVTSCSSSNIVTCWELMRFRSVWTSLVQLLKTLYVNDTRLISAPKNVFIWNFKQKHIPGLLKEKCHIMQLLTKLQNVKLRVDVCPHWTVSSGRSCAYKLPEHCPHTQTQHQRGDDGNSEIHIDRYWVPSGFSRASFLL